MWWLWLIVALIAAVVEVVGSGLVFIGVAGAALVAAIIAVFVPAILVQAIVFAAASAGYVILLRPTVLRLISGQHLTLPGPQSTTQHVVGRRGIVTHEVNEDGGQIRIGHGEFWSARSYNADETLPEGSRVEVVLVDGLTALVAPAATTTPELSDTHSS